MSKVNKRNSDQNYDKNEFVENENEFDPFRIIYNVPFCSNSQ
jgi:hypothetical protein